LANINSIFIENYTNFALKAAAVCEYIKIFKGGAQLNEKFFLEWLHFQDDE